MKKMSIQKLVIKYHTTPSDVEGVQQNLDRAFDVLFNTVIADKKQYKISLDSMEHKAYNDILRTQKHD